MSAIITHRGFRPWLHSDFMYWLLGYVKEHDACVKTLHQMSSSTLKARKKAFFEKKNNTKPDDEEGKEKEEVFGKLCGSV